MSCANRSIPPISTPTVSGAHCWLVDMAAKHRDHVGSCGILSPKLSFSVLLTYATLQGQERSPLVEVPWTHPPFIVLENMARTLGFPEDILFFPDAGILEPQQIREECQSDLGNGGTSTIDFMGLSNDRF